MPEATVFRYIPAEVSPREDPEGFVENARKFIRKHVKPEDAVKIMVSGGVDSTVTAALFHLEVGERLHVTHVDTGFMRLIGGREETEIVAERFSDFRHFKLVDARSLFYEKAMGIPDAEQKRLGFRRAYEIVTDGEMVESGCNVMTQGTILPDIIETDGGVKSQHNVQLRFSSVEKVVEPIAGLYKDEVREVAQSLWSAHGLKALKNVSTRQPFPGPGLSVRTIGVITPEKLALEKEANDLVESTVDNYTRQIYGVNLYIDPETGEQIPFQSFAATFDNKLVEAPQSVRVEVEKYGVKRCSLLDTKVTGVKGRLREGQGRLERIYSRPICIQTEVENYDVLREVGEKVPERTGFSRVLYRVAQGDEGSPHSVAIRSVRSVDALTAGIFEIPLERLRLMGEEMVRRCDVAEVYFDLSPKPPATIEYE
ncbi:MAG: hypothetical protein ACE5GD_07145 [Candidatus Geothermarchaeales archaeon]